MPDQSLPAQILVVLDDAAKREAISQALMRAGYLVDPVGTGSEALDRAPNGTALVILGVKLPDLNGFEVCRRLRANPATASLPILQISSTFQNADTQVHGLDTGADAYLTDISEPAVFLATVRALLRMRRAEETAQASARAWQATFDAITDGVFLLDRSGRMIRCNDALVAIVGRPASELVGRTAVELHRRLPAVAEVFAECLVTRQRAQIPLMVLDRYFRLTADPVFSSSGELAGAVGILSDVTDRRRAEEQRRVTEEQFRTVVDSVVDYAIFRTDPGGRITTWNEGVRRVLGYSESAFIGQNDRCLFTPEDVNAGVPAREMRLAADLGSTSSDRWMLRSDGARFWSSGTTSAVRGPDGEILGFTKVMRDQTIQKQFEETLQQTDRRKDEFLAMLGHELRNPLAPIRNALFLMKLQGPRDAVDVERLRSMMDRQISHIARLVDDLLDVSRINQGRMELRTEVLDVRQTIAYAVDEIRPFLDEREHTVHMHLPDDPVWVQADAVRLEQVFANLLHNAAKYTETRGHVTISAVVHGGTGEDSVPTPWVEISVRDSGIGIRPELIGRIFEMFAQGDRPSGRLKEGLGLGLTLVKTLVEMHGGEVDVTSRGPGFGSEFRVRLPLAASAVNDVHPDSPPIEPIRPLRILVVDDNRDAADSLQMVLRAQGEESVHVAYDGPAGVASAIEFHPDVALLDIGLPKGMDGYEVARRLRALPGLERLPIVALTGYGRPEDRNRSVQAGFTAHLVKPVNPKELRELLAQVRPT